MLKSSLPSLFGASALAALLLAACGGGSSVTPYSGNESNAPQAISAIRPEGVAVARTWSIQVGASTSDHAVQDHGYYAKTITIDAGDSITWRVATVYSLHTVTLLRPNQTPPPPTDANLIPAGGSTYDGTTYTSSGRLGGLFTRLGYTLTFTKPGTYTVYCLLHQPAMEGTIVVNPAGTAYPHDQSFYTHQGEIDEWADLNAAAASVNEFPFPPGGTTLAAGISPGLATADPMPRGTVLKFLSKKGYGSYGGGNFGGETGYVTIKVGTTLTWVNESSNERHTVTFEGPGSRGGPPDPAFGGHTYDGTKGVNSGTILPGHSFSLKFTKPGCFIYICRYHNQTDILMISHINVVP